MSKPLFEQLTRLAEKKRIPFHTPGHMAGRLLNHDIFRLDVTELPETDNLSRPTGVIAEAEKLAARAFGAEHTHFLTNGSTSGVLAMLYAYPGRVLVEQNCHTSALNALTLARSEPYFLPNAFDMDFGVPLPITPEQVERAFYDFPGARAVFVTSPNYFGLNGDLESIAHIAHKHNALLLVDEAHGAHFAFHPRLPKTAMEQGADICVQSMHKTLPAPNQAALLHTRRPFDRQFITMFHTTSPSYIIMGYMDYARELMERRGRVMWGGLIKRLDNLCLDKCLSYPRKDVTRLVLQPVGMSGLELSDRLRLEYNIAAETACARNVVFITTPAHGTEELNSLKNALVNLRGNGALPEPASYSPAQILPPYDAFFGR